MFEVLVETEALHRSKSGSITGPIFLRSPIGDFPEAGWSDFPVVILSWWIEGLREIESEQSHSFEGLFMDGPFAFVVQSGSGMTCVISWGKRGNASTVGIANISDILKSVVVAGRRVAKVCRENNWGGKDVELLERLVSHSVA